MRFVASILILAVAACAAPRSGEQGTALSPRVPLSSEFEHSAKMTFSGDSNTYLIDSRQIGGGAREVRVTPTSGPHADISNGSMAAREVQAVKAGVQYMNFQICGRKGARVLAGDGIFNPSENSWRFNAKCGA